METFRFVYHLQLLIKSLAKSMNPQSVGRWRPRLFLKEPSRDRTLLGPKPLIPFSKLRATRDQMLWISSPPRFPLDKVDMTPRRKTPFLQIVEIDPMIGFQPKQPAPNRESLKGRVEIGFN